MSVIKIDSSYFKFILVFKKIKQHRSEPTITVVPILMAPDLSPGKFWPMNYKKTWRCILLGCVWQSGFQVGWKKMRENEEGRLFGWYLVGRGEGGGKMCGGAQVFSLQTHQNDFPPKWGERKLCTSLPKFSYAQCTWALFQPFFFLSS